MFFWEICVDREGRVWEKEEFYAEQIRKKGYVCPGNIFNPELFELPFSEVCPNCEHFNNDCIVYGKRRKRGKNKIYLS